VIQAAVGSGMGNMRRGGRKNDIYPWGNEPQPDPERANYKDANLGEPGGRLFPTRLEPVFRLRGPGRHVWEWCLDVWHDQS
jgi:formylglycine-generating enzyme required for sulfatase activity